MLVFDEQPITLRVIGCSSKTRDEWMIAIQGVRDVFHRETKKDK